MSIQKEDEATIKLPPRMGGSDISALFEVCNRVLHGVGPITLDGSDVTFVDPMGVAVLGALLEPIKARRPATIEWLPRSVGTYLDRMDVLSRCGIAGVEPNHGVRHERQDLVELTCIAQEHEAEGAADRLAQALARTLTPANPDDPKDERTGKNAFDGFRHPISYMLKELLLNALSHAKREGYGHASVWVAAQYYKSNKTVRLAVVDNGCGMLGSLKSSPELEIKDHRNAIATALKPYVSCNPNLGLPGGTANRGVGLTTTNRIAKAANGGLRIVSGDASRVTNKHREITHDLTEGAFWQGVAIQMSAQRSDLPSVNIPQLLPEIEDPPEFELRFAT